MTYAETVDWLFAQLPNYQLQGGSAYKPGLANIKQLLTLTGNPEKGLRFFHVAGTNGKGSVSNMLASIMQENGYKTGLFTSPHLHDFRERIRVNGEMISEKFVIGFVAAYKDAWAAINPSFFEITTVMALEAFRQNDCDICVIETGLGGRLDSTNIIVPEVAIITNIGLDHTAFLGNTLEEIAFEKAGIIKENVPVVIGEWNERTQPAFQKAAREKKAELILAEKAIGYETDLAGSFQQKNLSTVLTTVKTLQKNGWQLDDVKIRTGLLNVAKNTGFRARFQKLQNHPDLIIDAAHNEDGVRVFLNEISNLKWDTLHLIYGAANDKDIRSIFKLLPANATYYFTEFNSKRTTKKIVFQELAAEFGLHAMFFENSADALNAARKSAGSTDLIAAFGSFYLVQEYL
ncbi:MAG: bifunctional folylpolyglutamate synthase/dihydrofolate synthase [Bacteroidetes bacterium]|nr:bifunctional folylpolyglutamate synthase/dihydrofolate synthase [Bacteroidota bacterium]